MALGLSLGMTKVLTMFCNWAKASGEVDYQINRDFLPAAMDAQTLTAYMAAVQQGLMSKESFFDLLQRGDVVDSELTFEEEQARIDSDPPPAPILGVPQGPGNEPPPKTPVKAAA